MLPAPEAGLVARDGALPALGFVLDEEAVTGALQAAWPDLRVSGAQRRYVRYKPRRNCLVSYSLSTLAGELTVYLKAYGGDAPVKLAKAEAKHAGAGGVSERVVLWPQRGAAAFRFPADRKLPQLPDLFAGAQPADWLTRLLPPAVRQGCVEVLAYKPERRCVVRLGDPGEPAAVVRLYAAAEFARAGAVAKVFRRGSAGQAYAAVLGTSARRRAAAWAWTEGQSLAAGMQAGSAGADDLEAVGAVLAGLHRTALPGLMPRPRPEFMGYAELLAVLDPAAAAVARRLGGRLQHLLQAPSPTCPVHGDFTAGQVVLAAGGPVLVDLDEAGIGAAAVDLGRFLAALEVATLSGELEATRAGHYGDALCRGYAAAGGRLPRDLQVHTAAALLGLVHEPFRRCRPDWPTLTDAILARACGMVGRTAATVASRPHAVRA